MNTMTIEYRNKQFIISKTEYKSRFFAKKQRSISKKGNRKRFPFSINGFQIRLFAKQKPIVSKRLQQQSFILTHAHHAVKHVFFAVFIAHITFKLAKRNVIIDVDDKCVHNHRIHIANFEF